MAGVFRNVHLASFDEKTDQFASKSDSLFNIEVKRAAEGGQIRFNTGDRFLYHIDVDRDTCFSPVGGLCMIISVNNESIKLKFQSQSDVQAFQLQLNHMVNPHKNSLFELRTDESSAAQYFQFYGYLSQQQNMMQDYIRTSTYQRAMLTNVVDFNDKVILDVGAGSGILSFFAAQAGARKVYGIEASTMAKHCEDLVHGNKMSDRITIIPGKVEEVELPEPVDVIISEPMGYMLFNERMLESFLHAKKWLKPGGKMFPSQGDLHISPFTDEALYLEQYSKANFWYQPAFHGVDLTCLRDAAVNEYFRQPIVDTFDIRICMARSLKYTVDFQTADEKDLYTIDIPLTFSMLQSGTVHGLAFWFDVAFLGTQQSIWLSTSPTEPLTHWYQVRCLLPNPVFVKQGQTLTGKVVLRSNKRQSYDVDIQLNVPGTTNRSTNTLDLKNPFFRYTGQAPAPPPGTNNESPSDSYWNNLAAAGAQQITNYSTNGILNGGVVLQTQQQGVGVIHTNLVPLANSSAPVNPGSIPSVGFCSQANTTRTSIGAGISPAAFSAQNQTYLMANNQFPISNQFMIGDYVMPGNVMMPEQGKSENIGQH